MVASLRAMTLLLLTAASAELRQYDKKWASIVENFWAPCKNTPLTPSNGGEGGVLGCKEVHGIREYKFPAGIFDIDRQVQVPPNTTIVGNANPIDSENKTKKMDMTNQTLFMATQGVSDASIDYCGTGGNMRQGSATQLRIGFLMNSNTNVTNINFQGLDTVRPYDNGNLCGGAVFETPGCVSPGFGDGKGDNWVNNLTCHDHTGAPNNLITGNGVGVENVFIQNVKLNDYLLKETSKSDLIAANGTQVAVWVAMTKDGSATRNVRVSNLVSTLQRGDGINFHGNVQNSKVEDCHIENTGDDIYAFWGAYAKNPSNVIFENNVGKNPGVTRNYGYGVCVAVYGAMSVTVKDTTCYDVEKWNPEQPDAECENGKYCNSCLAYVHDGWFGAVYPEGNEITLLNNKYLYMNGTSISLTGNRTLYRNDTNSAAHIVTRTDAPAIFVA